MLRRPGAASARTIDSACSRTGIGRDASWASLTEAEGSVHLNGVQSPEGTPQIARMMAGVTKELKPGSSAAAARKTSLDMGVGATSRSALFIALNVMTTLLTVTVCIARCIPAPPQSPAALLEAMSALREAQHSEIYRLWQKIDESDKRAAATAQRFERKLADFDSAISALTAAFNVEAGGSTQVDPLKLPTFASLPELPVNADGYLASHMFLVPAVCNATASEAQATEPHLTGQRTFGLASDALVAELGVIDVTCPEALCLWKDAPPHDLAKGVARYSGHRANEDLHAWAQRECEQVEIGFRNAGNDVLDLYWLHPLHRDRVHQGRIQPAEDANDAVFWRTVRIGHEFVAVDSASGSVVRRVFAEKQLAVYTVPRNDTLSAIYSSKYKDGDPIVEL